MMTVRFDGLPAMLEWKYGLVADCELREGAWKIVGWRHPSIIQPSEDQLTADFREWRAHLDATTYKRLRAAEYPPVADQLDAIWKALADLINGGTKNFVEVRAMADAIQAVKDKYPKPM